MLKYKKGLLISLLTGVTLLSSLAEAVIPNAPGNYVGITKISNSSVRISTKDNSDNEDGFYVSVYDHDTSALVKQKQLPASNKSSVYADITGLVCDKLYGVNVLAFNADGNSSSDTRYFNINSTFSPRCSNQDVPDAPGPYIGITDINKSSVAVNFLDNSNNEDGFLLFDESGDINVTIPKNNVTSPSQTYVTLTGLTCNKTYTLKVLAFNSNGNSATSDARSFNIHTTFGIDCDGNNTTPIANAGADQTVRENTQVQLDGSESYDADGDSLEYTWSIKRKPNGSNATINDNNLVNPTFTADINGTYILELIVNDGIENSIPNLVQIVVSSGGEVNYGTITGIVRDTDTNSVLSNVSLTINQTTVQSNGQGYFTFSNVTPANQAVIHIAKAGFVEISEILNVRAGMNSDINIYLRARVSEQITDSSNDMNLTQGNFEVDIPANGLVDENGQTFSGMAHIHLTPFDPTTDRGRRAFPGDFVGIRNNGTSEPLLSFGFIDINIVDNNGNKLNLAEGVNAFIRIPIPASLLTLAPTTIPLWWFNPVDGQWQEEGTLIQNANYYEGSISRLSILNADYPYRPSFVNGRLIHCQTNEPVKCGEIIVKGNGWSSRKSCTNDDGTFNQLSVMPNTNNIGIYGRKNGVRSDISLFTSLNIGQTYDIGDICINNPVAKITLTWEAQPQDLDAHLTFDNGNGNREMIYYSQKNANDDSASLDTDDTDGWGPEIITISTWHDGTYRYAVHHYSGSSNISNSGALLNMIIDKNGNGNTTIFSLLPSSGAQGSKDVWSAWDIDIQAGQVQDIRVVDNYLHSIGDADINAFSPNP